MSALRPRNNRWPIQCYCADGGGAGPAPGLPRSMEFSGLTKKGTPRRRICYFPTLSISSQGLYGSNLLERRMVALNLDPEEVARSEPALFRSFQRLCTSCQSPMRCARDLAQEFARDPSEPASSDWRDYCPNGTTLNMLSTLQSCSPDNEEEARSLTPSSTQFT